MIESRLGWVCPDLRVDLGRGAAGMEMFLVRPGDTTPSQAIEEIAEYAAQHGGLVLMATTAGSLILGMPPGGKEVLERHPYVGFIGGVTIDESKPGARALRQRFALNAARQLAARGVMPGQQETER
jgi:hypothetical protein